MTAKTHEIPTFLDHTAPVELVTHLESLECQGNTVTLVVGDFKMRVRCQPVSM